MGIWFKMKKKLCLILLVLLSLQLLFIISSFEVNSENSNYSTVINQDGSFEDNLDLVGQWDQNYGRMEGLFVKDNYAFIAAEGLIILDISFPASPTFVSQFKDNETGSTYGVFVEDDLAYIVGYKKGLRIIDISDISNPTLVGSCGEYGDGVVVQGDYAYVFGSIDAFEIFDVSSPENPVLVGYISQFNYSPLDSISVKGSYVYLSSNGGIDIIDVSDPTAPIRITKYDSICAHDFVIVGDIAFVAGGYEGLTIHNISDPYNPFQISSLYFGYYVYSIGFLKDVVYLTNRQNGLTVVIVSDVVNPVEISNSLNFSSNYILEVYDDILYLGNYENQLLVYEIINPFTLIPLNKFYMGGWAYDFVIKETYAYLANGVEGLVILDISDSRDPFLISRVFLGNYTKRVFSYENTLFVVVGYAGSGYLKEKIVILDISNPADPQIAYEFGEYGLVFDLQFKDEVMFVASSDYLEIFDITHPTFPKLKNQYESFGYTISLKIIDNTVILGTTKGLVILEFLSQYSVTLIDYFFNSCSILEISIEGDLGSLFIRNNMAEKYQILVVDFSDLRNPLNQSFLSIDDINTGGYILIFNRRIILDNKIIYCCTTERFIILKLSKDNQLELIGQYTNDDLTKIVLVDDLIFLTANYDGLLVLQNQFTKKASVKLLPHLLLATMMIISVKRMRKKKRGSIE